MNPSSTVLTPATVIDLLGLRDRNPRTRGGRLALLCAPVSPATWRRVLYQQVPWSRRLWDFGAQGRVQTGGSLGIEDPSGERFTRGAEAGSGGWASRVGQPVGGRPVVRLVGTKGKWKGPLGIGLWRKGGPSTVECALGLLRQARRRGRQPAYVLWESWAAAAETLNVLAGGGRR